MGYFQGDITFQPFFSVRQDSWTSAFPAAGFYRVIVRFLFFSPSESSRREKY